MQLSPALIKLLVSERGNSDAIGEITPIEQKFLTNNLGTVTLFLAHRYDLYVIQKLSHGAFGPRRHCRTILSVNTIATITFNSRGLITVVSSRTEDSRKFFLNSQSTQTICPIPSPLQISQTQDTYRLHPFPDQYPSHYMLTHPKSESNKVFYPNHSISSPTATSSESPAVCYKPCSRTFYEDYPELTPHPWYSGLSRPEGLRNETYIPTAFPSPFHEHLHVNEIQKISTSGFGSVASGPLEQPLLLTRRYSSRIVQGEHTNNFNNFSFPELPFPGELLLSGLNQENSARIGEGDHLETGAVTGEPGGKNTPPPL